MEKEGKNYFTLQLSVNALEHIFKDAGEDFVLKIQQGVVEEFCRRRVKAFTDETILKMVSEAIKTTIGSVEYKYPKNVVKLTPEYKEAFEQAADAITKQYISHISDEFRKIVDEKISKVYEEAVKKIDRAIDSYFLAKAELYIKKSIDTKVQAIISDLSKNSQ